MIVLSFLLFFNFYTGVKCGKGHDMTIDSTQGFVCDKCDKKLKEERRWRCKECDEDFCFDCIPFKLGKYEFFRF